MLYNDFFNSAISKSQFLNVQNIYPANFYCDLNTEKTPEERQHL